MKAAPLFLTATSALWLAPPAHAGWFSRGDDCSPGTRHARAEYGCEHAASKRLESLDCCALRSYAESYRMALNERVRMTYYRPVTELAPAQILPTPAQPLPGPAADLAPSPASEAPAPPRR